MANLKEIRTRLGSVKTTRQITSAMKMVSAAKLRKAQDAIIQMRPYANNLQQILTDLSKNVESDAFDKFKRKRTPKKVLLIVITSNKGLCGAFNANVAKKALTEVSEKFSDIYNKGGVDIVCIGKKGAEFIKSKGFKIAQNHHNLFDNLNYNSVQEVATDFIERYLKEEYDLIKLYYNSFRNAATQEVTSEQLLPLPDEVQANAFEKEYFDYILEPSQEDIFKDLIPKSLKIKVYKALLESNASEHGARMTSMHKATDNATEMIKSLQLDYNKARQATITNEILEIVGGANALKG
jgi:F-type H+-transporting ATPase subunit gamma